MIVLLLLAAASAHLPTTTPNRTAPRTPSACLTLTRTDIQFALGRSVGKPEEETTPASSTCDYAAERGRVTVTRQRLEREPDLAAEVAALLREIEGASVRPAAAFGAKAFFLDIAGGGTQLHVIRGRDYLMVSVLGFGDAAHVSAAVEQMARTALSRR